MPYNLEAINVCNSEQIQPGPIIINIINNDVKITDNDYQNYIIWLTKDKIINEMTEEIK